MAKVNLTNVYNILSRCIFGSVIVFPLSLSNYNLSHLEGLSLKYSKTAPPLAIFDDEKISPLADNTEFNPVAKKLILQTDRVQIRKMAIKVARKFETLQKVYLSENHPQVPARMLAGLSLQKDSHIVSVIQKTISLPPTQITKTINFKKSTAPVAYAKPAVPPSTATQEFALNVNPRLRERVEEVENLNEVLQEDYQADSFENRANEVLAREGIDLHAPTDREIANTDDTGFGKRKTYVQRMEDVAKREQNSLADKFARSGYVYDHNRAKPPSENPTNDVDNPDSINRGNSQDKGTSIVSRSPIKQAMISGTIEMTRGLALTGDQKIIVYRQIGGTRTGEGQVFINEGRYEIFVDEPNTGVVVAELLDGDAMIGRAEILMPEVMLNAKTPADLKKVPIKIEPVIDQVVAENISAYSYLKKEKIKNTNVIISDTLNANTKIFNSSVLVKAMKENYWGNIILGSSKQIFTNILSPDATIKALTEILGIKTSKEQMGIIKGDITIAGNKVSGAEVEIVGPDGENLKPVYFNSFIPDTNLNQTSENGQYAFVDIPQGNYFVRAKYKGKYLSPQLAPVEPGFVTQVQFDVQKPSLAEAFVFDIQTSEMMSANINFLGSEQKVPVQSRKLISFSGSEGIQFLEVQAQDQNYYSTRVTVDKSEKEILIPMISQSWLSGLLSRLRVNSIPETGLIIGTALDLQYSVVLDPRAYNEDTKIVYFDSHGKLVPGALKTPVGGGFVAINVNPGIRSLFNKYDGASNLKISTMAVDSSAINVFNSKF